MTTLTTRKTERFGWITEFLPGRTTDDYSRNGRLFSRKWLVGAGTVAGLFFCTIFVENVSLAQCFSIVAAAIAYIAGEAYVDGKKAG